MKMPFKRLPSGVGNGSWIYFFSDGTTASEWDASRDTIDKYEEHLRQLNAERSRPWPADPVTELQREVSDLKEQVDDLKAVQKSLVATLGKLNAWSAK